MGSVQPEASSGHIYLQKDVSGEFMRLVQATTHTSPDLFLEHLLELFMKSEADTKVVKVRPDLAQKFTSAQCKTPFRSNDDLMRHLLNLHVKHQKSATTLSTPPQERRTSGRKSRKSQPKKNYQHTALLDSDEESVEHSPNNVSSNSWKGMSVSGMDDTIDISTQDKSDSSATFDLSRVKQEADDHIAAVKQNEKAHLIRRIFQKREQVELTKSTRKCQKRSRRGVNKGKLNIEEKVNSHLIEETRKACVVIENVEAESSCYQYSNSQNSHKKNKLTEYKDDKHAAKHSHSQSTAKSYSYTCYKCKRNMRTRSLLNLHMASEHNEISEVGIMCTQCGRKVDYDHELELHRIFLCRKSTRKYKCDSCTLCFCSQADLSKHPCTKNSCKPYFCTMSDCVFAGKCLKDLTEHVTRHLGIKPFLCNVCGRAFAAKKDLDRHAEIHSELKNHTCLVCGKLYKSSNTLKRHMMIHKFKDRYQCAQCSYMTALRACFNAHMLKHKKRTHLCDICKKTLRSESSLKNHIRNRHTFNRIFTCRHCEFTSDDGLRYSSHMRKHRNLKVSEKTGDASQAVMLASCSSQLPHTTSNMDHTTHEFFNVAVPTMTSAYSNVSIALTATVLSDEEVNISGQHADTIMADYVTDSETTEISVITSDGNGSGLIMYNVEIPSGSDSVATGSPTKLSMPTLIHEAIPSLMESEHWGSQSNSNCTDHE
ncbi:zinc finger protein 624-like isoform X2 [Dreissena polymorpha]|uniref:C2H2-type domain-containing protein n=1 Tax=Dreissena polymorpha TaxID=45954 RepID=A0A9D4S6A7_DREPO|nr:zinc finger protein 624-like isoform X2 [Dreissena polymorpha]KAH3891482.1 hypothetical protein DPMN_015586 [Dreissena polymorpha]